MKLILTQDSVGKVYPTKDGAKVVKIVAELPDDAFYDFVGVTGCGDTHFYMANGHQGRYGQGGYNLQISPPRTKDEVGEIAIGLLGQCTRLLDRAGVVHPVCEEFLAEARATFGGEK